MSSDRVKAFVELVMIADDHDVVDAVDLVTDDPDVQSMLRNLAGMSRSLLQVCLRGIPEATLPLARDGMVGQVLQDVDEVDENAVVVDCTERPPYPAEPKRSERTVRLLAALGEDSR